MAQFSTTKVVNSRQCSHPNLICLRGRVANDQPNVHMIRDGDQKCFSELGEVGDIVCGGLQAKLLTKDLCCGSSRCIDFGTLTLTPCEFQHKAVLLRTGRITCYCHPPLSRFLESFVDDFGKRYYRFIGVSCSQDTWLWRTLSPVCCLWKPPLFLFT